MKKLALMLGVAAIFAAGTASAETYTLTTQHRALIGDWMVKTNGCPAGSTAVREKHLLRDDSIRCVVPKARTVYYKAGATIPQTVTYTELPTTIVSQLPAPPAGEVYVAADGNVYLIKPESRTVVEAITVVGAE